MPRRRGERAGLIVVLSLRPYRLAFHVHVVSLIEDRVAVIIVHRGSIAAEPIGEPEPRGRGPCCGSETRGSPYPGVAIVPVGREDVVVVEVAPHVPSLGISYVGRDILDVRPGNESGRTAPGAVHVPCCDTGAVNPSVAICRRNVAQTGIGGQPEKLVQLIPRNSSIVPLPIGTGSITISQTVVREVPHLLGAIGLLRAIDLLGAIDLAAKTAHIGIAVTAEAVAEVAASDGPTPGVSTKSAFSKATAEASTEASAMVHRSRGQRRHSGGKP